VTYFASFPNENKPKWFTDRLVSLPWYYDKPWTWVWNDTYDNRVRIRSGKIELEFTDEAAYTWFILKEL
jgi:hypothetical protein